MGFKDIQLFNQALLAKQAWKVLQDPDCLLSRFLKSRYFVNGDFLQADLGRRPSYAWKSLIFCRALLKVGLKQMVGNGSSLRVWISRWISDGKMRSPFMKNILIDLELKVEDLIDNTSKWWDRDKLEELFTKGDIEIILKIKPVLDSNDFWCWEYNRSGDYSVKSGYWLANQTFNKDLIKEASMLPSLNGVKDQIWKIQTSSKIKIFLWKVSSGAIPVSDNLAKRGLKVDSRCQLCGLEGESTNHVLFTCTLARQVWAMSNIPCPKSGFSKGSVFQNLVYLLDLRKGVDGPCPEIDAFPWILWRLWKNRSNFVFEGLIFLASVTMGKVSNDANNWFLSQGQDVLKASRDIQVKPSVLLKWSRPPLSWVKCNIGASWNKLKSIGGAAWVLRNDRGEGLLHSRRSFVLVKSELEAKLESWLWAIDCMKNLKVTKVIFAIQCPILFVAVNRPKAWPFFSFSQIPC